jgi:hypothetical protein
MMPRDLRANENVKRAKAKRQFALERREMLQPTVPRVSAAGPISMAIKVDLFRAMIDAEIERRKSNV